jgi:hypothetical protein
MTVKIRLKFVYDTVNVGVFLQNNNSFALKILPEDGSGQPKQTWRCGVIT